MVTTDSIMICNVGLQKLAFPDFATVIALLLLHACAFVVAVVFTIRTVALFVCRFIVLSSLLCCGGFIYKTRVEHQVFFSFFFLFCEVIE